MVAISLCGIDLIDLTPLPIALTKKDVFSTINGSQAQWYVRPLIQGSLSGFFFPEEPKFT